MTTFLFAAAVAPYRYEMIPIEVHLPSLAWKGTREARRLLVNGQLLSGTYPVDAEASVEPTRDPDLFVGKVSFFRSGTLTVDCGTGFVVWKKRVYQWRYPQPPASVHVGPDGRATLITMERGSLDQWIVRTASFDRGTWQLYENEARFFGLEGRQYRVTGTRTAKGMVQFQTECLLGNTWKHFSNGAFVDANSQGSVLVTDALQGYPTKNWIRKASGAVTPIPKDKAYILPAYLGEDGEVLLRPAMGNSFSLCNGSPLIRHEEIRGWPDKTWYRECYGWRDSGWLLKVSNSGRKDRFVIFRRLKA